MKKSKEILKYSSLVNKLPNIMELIKFQKDCSKSMELNVFMILQLLKLDLQDWQLALQWWDSFLSSNSWHGTSLFKPLIISLTVVPKQDTWVTINLVEESFSEDWMVQQLLSLPNIHNVSPVTIQVYQG